MFLAGDFHCNDTHVLLVGDWKGQLFETVWTSRGSLHRFGHAGEARIESHLRAIEIMSLKGLLESGRIGMAGDTDCSCDLLFPGFVKCLEHAVWFLNRREVFR